MRAGFWEILLIVVLVLVLFGHNKIPGLMKNMANGINIFKKEIKETKDATRDVVQARANAHRAAGAKKNATTAPATRSKTKKAAPATRTGAKKSLKK